MERLDFSKISRLQNRRSGSRRMCCSVVFLGIMVGLSLLACTGFVPGKDQRAIKQIAVLFRHGQKNPTESYANDPHIHHPWEGGWAALTKKGQRQLYKLGQWLRHQYDFTISRKYNSKTTLVRSSYKERTIMSAQALLAGLFHPEPADYLADNLPWNPAPVFTIPAKQDRFFTWEPSCPKFHDALREVFANAAANDEEEIESLYKFISHHSGKKIETRMAVTYLYDTIAIQKECGLTLPDWAMKMYDGMQKWLLESVSLYTSTPLLKRLLGGPLLKEITDNMMNMEKGIDEKTLYLYAGHDLTIMNILGSMGFTNLSRPEYGAALIFELAMSGDIENVESELEVKVKYLNNTEMEDARLLQIPGCLHPCKLGRLRQLWKHIFPVDYESECKV